MAGFFGGGGGAQPPFGAGFGAVGGGFGAPAGGGGFGGFGGAPAPVVEAAAVDLEARPPAAAVADSYSSLAWAPDGRHLSVAGWDQKVHVFSVEQDAASGRCAALKHVLSTAEHGRAAGQPRQAQERRAQRAPRAGRPDALRRDGRLGQ